MALLRYIVRYGERVLYDYVDEETNEHVIMRVADYIRFDLERDDLTFYTPAFKQMLDELLNIVKTRALWPVVISLPIRTRTSAGLPQPY